MTDLHDLMAVLPAWFAGLLGGVVGLCIGSYLATILSRWPRNLRTRDGRSRCDSCHAAIGPLHLVPIVGYVLARGRCRNCGSSIDPDHLTMEAICGVTGAVCGAAGVLLAAPFLWLLTVLAMFDAKYFWLPDRLVMACALAALLVPSAAEWHLRVLGGIVGFALLWIVAAAYRRIRGRVGLGGGDAKLFGAIGLWCGALNLPLVLLIASLLGLLDAAIRTVRGGDAATMRIPLGTHLSLAAAGLLLFEAALNGSV